MLMRMFRRFLVVVSVTAAATIAIVTLAMAVSVPVTTTFTGASKHKHYVVNLVPECFTSGCTRATTIAVQVTTGSQKHPAAKCVFGTFQLPNAKLHRGRFSAGGRFLAGSRTITIKASGVFTTSTRAHGTVTGPRACGATDSFRLAGVAR